MLFVGVCIVLFYVSLALFVLCIVLLLALLLVGVYYNLYLVEFYIVHSVHIAGTCLYVCTVHGDIHCGFGSARMARCSSCIVLLITTVATDSLTR